MKFFESYTPGHRRINPALLWDYDFKPGEESRYLRLIATRTAKIGKLEDFYAAFDLFGGIKSFSRFVKTTVVGLTDKELNFICQAFGFKKEDTECYKRAQLRKERVPSLNSLKDDYFGSVLL